MLVCMKCKESKDESEFYHNAARKSGYGQDCKACVQEYYKTHDKKPKGNISAKKAGHKVCRNCSVDKPVSEFRAHRAGGYKSWCKACEKVYFKSLRDKKTKRVKVHRLPYKKPRIYDTCNVCHKKSTKTVCNACLKEKKRIERQCKECQTIKPAAEFKGKSCVCNECKAKRPKIVKVTTPEDRERINARSRDRYATDPEYRIATLSAAKKYQKDNPDKMRESDRRYRREHRDKARQKERNRECRERGAEGAYSESEWIAVLDRYKHQCLRCHKTDLEVEITRDHIRSIKRGGSNYITNMQPLCRSCNSIKGDWNIDYRPMYAM